MMADSSDSSKADMAQPKLIATANVSLGFAFLLSFVLSLGTRLLNLLGVTSALRILEPYQSHLVNAFASYWIPALLVYVALRLSHIDRKLSYSTLVHVTIFVANLLLTLYVFVRVLASTVSGGGGSFAVMSLSPLVIIPSIVLLAVGFLVLLTRTLRISNHSDSQASPTVIRRNERFSIAVVLCIPLAFVVSLPVGKMLKMVSGFSRLCEATEIRVIEPVVGAKSVALLPDKFAEIQMAMNGGMNSMTWNSQSVFLLNQSLLEFVEVPATKKSGISDQTDFERISTVGERIRRGNDQNKKTQFLIEPINAITAEYEVRPVATDLKELADAGLGGSRIEIRRRADNKLIAYAQYYWSSFEYKACPKEAIGSQFVYRFVSNALGVNNPDSPSQR